MTDETFGLDRACYHVSDLWGRTERVTTARDASDVSQPDLRDFAEFYAATYDSLCIQLYAHTGEMAEAQDVVQEAYCRAFDGSARSTVNDPDRDRYPTRVSVPAPLEPTDEPH